MEETKFKIKVSNTEYAAVEIRPVEDGVEIVLRKKEEPKKGGYKFNDARDSVSKKRGMQHVDNYEILRNFYSEKENEPGVNQKQLLAFYNFYNKRILEWDGVFMPERLFEKWKKTEFEK